MAFKMKRLIALIIILLLSQSLFSESFRVKKIVQTEMNNETDVKVLTLGMGEALHILLPEERLLLQAVQLKIKIPAALADYGGAVAYSFYRDIQPSPTESIIDYNAERVLIGTFTNRLTYYLDIPLVQEAKLSDDPYTSTILLPLDDPISDIFFRVHIVMKGVPDGLWDSSIEVELKPVLANKGILNLMVTYPSEIRGNTNEYPFIVFIDDDLIEFSNKEILLDTGMHHVTVSSEFFRNEVQTFTIEKAKDTYVEIELQDIAPLLTISAPENTQFFLNDIEYHDFSEPIKVETGKNHLRFSIGEYEIIRTLEVLNGKTYNIDVSFDVDITEE